MLCQRVRDRPTELNHALAGAGALDAQAVRNHPGFARFRQQHMRDMTRELMACRAEMRLMLEARHQVIARLIVGLHCGSRKQRPETWATIARLQAVVADCGLASPRSVTEIVARLRSRGMVESSRSSEDGRARVLRPDSRLIDHDRQFLRALLGPLVHIYTDGRYRPIAMADPDFHARYRAVWSRRAASTVQPFRRNPPMRALYRRGAGMPLLFTILADQYAHGRCELSFGELGERLSVSRTQVREILETGRREGLFEFKRAGGGAVATPAMCEAFDQLLADCAVAYTDILADVLQRSAGPEA